MATWREHKAEQRNLPRGWILSNSLLLAICSRRPKNIAELAKIKEITAGTIKHAGKEIIAIIAQSKITDERESTGNMPLLAEQRKRVREIMKFLEQRAEQEKN